jgi:hypothetical protein
MQETTMIRSFRSLAVVAALSFPFAVALAGDAGGAPNEAPKAAPAAGAATAATSAVDKLAMASQLAAWGRESKSPEALLAASQMLMEIPAEMRDAKHDSKAGDAAAAAQTKADEPAPTLDPVALQKEAATLAAAKGDKNLQKYVDSVVKAGTTGARGATGGPKYSVTKVSAGYTDVYNVEFRGGELAEIAISGDGDTDLDLYVYDEYGNYIGSDTGSTDTAYVSWTPRWTGNFRIEVKNNGYVYNQYVVISN